MTAQVHIAGLDIEVSPYLRQRCGWCGAVLVDYDLTRVARPLEPGEDPDDPKPWRPATWPVGSLIEVDGPCSALVPHVDGDKLPANACAQIDPAVTV